MTLLISSLIILPPANPFEHHRPAVGVAALLSRTNLLDQEGHPPAEMETQHRLQKEIALQASSSSSLSLSGPNNLASATHCALGMSGTSHF